MIAYAVIVDGHMSDSASRLRNFLSELRRRKVIRVGLVYLALAWVIVQVVDSTFEHLPLPNGSETLVLVLLAIGFPVALALAWAYEMTPDGVNGTIPTRTHKLAGILQRWLPSRRKHRLPSCPSWT